MVVKFIKTGRMVVSGTRRRERGIRSYIMHMEFCKLKIVLEIHSHCTTV